MNAKGEPPRHQGTKALFGSSSDGLLQICAAGINRIIRYTAVEEMQ
jgi:hypothetical protein